MVEVRGLELEELPLISKVWKSAGLSYRSHGRDSLGNLNAQWRRNPEYFLGAFLDGSIVGVSLVTDDGRRGWINRLAVVPRARRAGIASRLVKASEAVLRKHGIKVFCVHVVKDNEISIALFNRLGYKGMTEILYLSKRPSESC